MLIDDFEHAAVPAFARKGFGSMVSVWITFQVSTVMLYFGAITIAHMDLWKALLVAGIAALIIACVSGVVGYLGAKTGLSTSLLCEHVFGFRGGKCQQVFQGLVEFGWFVVIVGLTGTTVGAMLHLTLRSGLSAVTFLTGCISIVSVYFGFRGVRWVAVLSNPIIIAIFLFVVTAYIARTTGLVWRPAPTGPDFFSSITLATGTFITGATLSADLMRFASTAKSGALAGFLTFLVTIPGLLLIGAIISMTNNGNPDFVLSVSRIGFGTLLLLWVILTNWTTADTTLYLAIIPLKKLTTLGRGALVVGTGLAGALVAALGVSSYISTWLTSLGILLPPLAGPLFVLAGRLFRGGQLPERSAGINWLAIMAWGIGVSVAAVAQGTKLPGPPMWGMITSGLVYAANTRMTNPIIKVQKQ